MNLKDPKTKKIIVIAAIVIVILVVIFFVYKRNKKKKAEKNQQPIRFQQQQEPSPEQSATQTTPSVPKRQIIPEEDKTVSQATEPALSVEQVIQTAEKPKERQPVSNGNMGAAPGNPNVIKKPAAPVHSSLPPEFMTNANDPNAGQ